MDEHILVTYTINGGKYTMVHIWAYSIEGVINKFDEWQNQFKGELLNIVSIIKL